MVRGIADAHKALLNAWLSSVQSLLYTWAVPASTIVASDFYLIVRVRNEPCCLDYNLSLRPKINLMSRLIFFACESYCLLHDTILLPPTPCCVSSSSTSALLELLAYDLIFDSSRAKWAKCLDYNLSLRPSLAHHWDCLLVSGSAL